jgi:endonuclease/exonuclease/phosphatase family metal-dependent hydrolase
MVKVPLIVLNFIAVFALLLVYISPYIHPETATLPSLTGLGFPIILAINILFVLIWIIAKKKIAILSFICIALGWNYIGGLIQFNSHQEITNKNDTFKILSYNVQNFYHINISTTKYLKDFDNRDLIIDFLSEQDADIVCLQEILHDKGNNSGFIEELGKKLNCPYSYYKNYYQSNNKIVEAIITYSKFPIIRSDNLIYEKKTMALFHDIKKDEDTIRLYNLHLASIHFGKDEYDFISEMGSGKENKEIKENTLKIVGRLNNAFKKRGNQADVLSRHINSSPYPVFICGDFNDTQTSYTYHQISNGLKDAFRESGKGFAKTFAGENFPSLRIDHILHDPGVRSLNFTRHKIKLSDHYPVSCFFVKK